MLPGGNASRKVTHILHVYMHLLGGCAASQSRPVTPMEVDARNISVAFVSVGENSAENSILFIAALRV